MTLIGLVGMHDPPRAEVKAAVRDCQSAGIRLIAVTGDNRATAEAVCKSVGFWRADAEPFSSLTGIAWLSTQLMLGCSKNLWDAFT